MQLWLGQRTASQRYTARIADGRLPENTAVMNNLNLLSATEAVKQIAAGNITSEQLVRDCLERIAAREPVVGAWAHLDAVQQSL